MWALKFVAGFSISVVKRDKKKGIVSKNRAFPQLGVKLNSISANWALLIGSFNSLKAY